MTVTRYDLTGDVTDLTGGAISVPKNPVVVLVEANSPAVLDMDGNTAQVGLVMAELDGDGTFTVPDLVATNSADVNPASGRAYRVHIHYPEPTGHLDRYNQPAYRRKKWTSGWFPLTANTDLADIDEAIDPEPGWRTEFMTQAEALLEAQVLLSGISTTDAAVAGLVSNILLGPLTQSALNASYVGATVAAGAGIDPTGATDSTAALQDRLDEAATTTRHVVIPPGTYLLSDTLTLNHGVTVSGFGPASVLKADDEADYEYMIVADTKTNVTVRDLKLDGNKTARIAAGVVNRSVGISFDSCTDAAVRNVVVTGTFGLAPGSSAGAISLGNCTRGRVESCTVYDCGTDAHPCDGIYTSGVQNLISDCIAKDCHDTAFIIENSQMSGIVGCTSIGSYAVAAITNAQASVAFGNYIDGLTGYDWDAINTGGIAIGNPINTTTGDLVNTMVSNVLLERAAGDGPGIKVAKTGAADTVGLTISNVRIKGAGSQGMDIEGENVIITNCFVEGTTDACIQINEDSDTVLIQGCHLRFTTTFGIAVNDGADDVTLMNNYIDGQGTGNWGIYWFGTCANAVAFGNTVVGYDVGAIGSDGGTTPRVVTPHPSGSGLLFGKAGTAGIYMVGDLVQSDAGYRCGGVFHHWGTDVGFYGATPTVKQTGVAVTAAAIHAALVNLGLIGA